MVREQAAVQQLIHEIIALRVAIKQFYFQKIKDMNLDVTYEMVQVLAVLWREHELNQQEIAELVQKSKASVTPLIDNLCKRDLVQRIPDPADRRNNKIILTEKGWEYHKHLEPVQKELYEKIIKNTQIKDLSEINNQLRLLKNAME